MPISPSLITFLFILGVTPISTSKHSEVDRSHHISGSHAELLSPHYDHKTLATDTGVSSSVLLHGGSSHRVARLDFDVRILLTKKLRLTEVRRLHNGDDKGDHGKR